MREPQPSDDLDGMLDTVWAMLAAGSSDRRAALHTPTVATIVDGMPSARVMVLRGADRDLRRLTFHSDIRAVKVAALGTEPRVAVTGYDADARLQFRLGGVATVRSGSAVAARWAAIGGFGRRAYQTTLPPGSTLGSPGSGLPADLDTVDAAAVAGDAGSANFAVIEIVLDRIEWLLLAHDGHRRAAYDHGGNGWTGRWLVP